MIKIFSFLGCSCKIRVLCRSFLTLQSSWWLRFLPDLLAASLSHGLGACKLSAVLAFLPQPPRQGEAVLGTGDLQSPHRIGIRLSQIIPARQGLLGETASAQRLSLSPPDLEELGVLEALEAHWDCLCQTDCKHLCIYLSLICWIGVLLKYLFMFLWRK